METGRLSFRYLCDLAPVGSSVMLQMEKVDDYDLYGQTQTYFFLQDGSYVNEVMIRKDMPNLMSVIAVKPWQLISS
jgi:hypothetical protein